MRRTPATLALLPLVGAALLAAAAPAPSPTPRPGATPSYQENVEVVATAVLATPPQGAGKLKAPSDWLVRENGADRKVERVEGIGDEPWEILVWVDGPLCRQESLSRTTVALARQAQELVKLGNVRVVVANPEPRIVLASTRTTGAVVDALAGVAGDDHLCTREPDTLLSRARGYAEPPKQTAGMTVDVGMPHPTMEGAASALHELRSLVEQRTALIAATVGHCPAASCALFYVGEGYTLDPDLQLPATVRPADARDVAAALATATDGLARALALHHWLLVALPFAPPPSPDQPSEAERVLPKEARPGPPPFPEQGDYAPPGMPPIREREVNKTPAAATDVYTETQLAPLRRIAERTAGDILRVPDQLAATLAALRDRRWIWYRTEPFKAGEVRTLEVLAGKPLRQASAAAWVGAPER
jgi:hypothetical protein